MLRNLSLTPTERDAILALERASFEDHCRRLHYSPGAHEQYLLQRVKEEFRLMLEMMSADHGGLSEGVLAASREYLDAPDWWTYKRLEIRDAIT